METWRSDNPDDEDVIEIVPVEEYDSTKAKLRASLFWILNKAYQDGIPKEFQDPFYERGEGDWHIKPGLANVLASSELYCQACRYMFGENASQWQGHWSIIQVLSRKGIYAVSSDSVEVTETVLMQSAPFKVKAHLALIDALMLALTREIMTVERVTRTVRRFTTFHASSELPTDTEGAVLFWVNKVCSAVQHLLDKQQEKILEGGETNQKVRIVSRRASSDLLSVPTLENFLSDLSDGCCLAVLISFYCPDILKLEDVCLKSNVGIADSLYNLRLIKSFCDRHLPHKTCQVTYEDLLYTHDSMMENLLVMAAEIFYWFEIKRLPFVTGAGLSPPVEDPDTSVPRTPTATPTASKIQVNVANVPISNVTKQSFQRLKLDSELRLSGGQDMHRQLAGSVPPRMPLLQKRHQQGQGQVHFQDDHSIIPDRRVVQRSSSATRDTHIHGGGGLPKDSVIAWPPNSPAEGSRLPQQQLAETAVSGGSSNLLANVSIDSDMNASFSSGSIDLGELEPTPRTDRTDLSEILQREENAIHLTLQNKKGTPFPSQTQKADYPPDGECPSTDVNVISHGEEHSKGNYSNNCVEDSDPVNDNVEPLMPARLKPLKEKANSHTKEEERGDSPRRPGKLVEVDPHLAICDRSDRSSEGQDQGHVLTHQPMSQTAASNMGVNLTTDAKKYDTFFVRGSIGDSHEQMSHRSNVTDGEVVNESFTMMDNIQTPEAARAAGIPVVDSSENAFRRQTSREGSISSSRSSGDFSDHESRKIHIDHKSKEAKDVRSELFLQSSQPDVTNPAGFILQKPVIVARQPRDSEKENLANFAQIKQMKQIGNVDNSGLIYMQHGNDEESHKNTLKDNFQKNKAEKKTSFAALPNQTTWQQQTVVTNNHSDASATTEPGSVAQELLKIKLKLEEKRKAIERKKHSQELQKQKMRQRLGKAAFLHVVNKAKDEPATKDAESVQRPQSLPPARMTTSDSDVPLAMSSARGNYRKSSASSDSSTHSPTNPRIPRPFSRDDIQQTIDNVRKKWFNDTDLVAPHGHERSESPEEWHSCSSDESDTKVVVSQPGRPAQQENAQTLAGQARQAQPRDMVKQRNEGQYVPKRNYDKSKPVEHSTSNNTQPTLANRHVPKPETIQQGQAQQVSVLPERIDANSETNEKPESYVEVNSSLDKLNQSLTDLQGEIMKLSLKQGQKPGMTTSDTSQQHGNVDKSEPRLNTRSRSRSPPNVLAVGNKNAHTTSIDTIPESRQASLSRGPSQANVRSSSVPRQVPENTAEQQIGNYDSRTLPRTYQHNAIAQQNQVPPFMLQHQGQVAGPAGPVYATNPTQFLPGTSGIPPTIQQYGSYLMGGPAPPQQVAPIPQMNPAMNAPYQHSPPHLYSQPNAMYPQQQAFTPQGLMITPPTQPYPGVYPSPPMTHPNFPPSSQVAGTFTTPSHPDHVPYPTVQQATPAVNGNLYQPQQLLQQQHHSQQQQQQQDLPLSQYANPQLTPPLTLPSAFGNQTASNIPHTEQNRTESNTERHIESERILNNDGDNLSEASNGSGGFFVAMHESPRRASKKAKPTEKHDVQTKRQSKVETKFEPTAQNVTSNVDQHSDYGSSVIADFAPTVAEPAVPLSAEANEKVQKAQSDQSGSQGDNSGIGFVVGHDESSLDQSAELEMQRKKDKIMMMRQRRQDDSERKQLHIEQQSNKKREADRLKQEESERRKSEEKARRELIFKQYLEKKEDDEGPKKRDEKPKQKTRPKSMFVKAGPTSHVAEGLADGSSSEDLSTRAYSASNDGNSMASKGSRNRLAPPPSRAMRKAVSCNTLHQNQDGADGKSLAFGGLTHRRPPSPDLYRLRKGPRSSDGSEAGSALGAEYSGPKLFVKPSAKSNRHIIINAISHCCLAGSVNMDPKNKVLEEVAKSNAKHFIILFRDASCGYRGLYGFDPDSEDTGKIVGVGPRQIANDMIEKYYKYNSGGKSFSVVSSTKHLSVSIDAISLKNSVWKPAKPPAKGYR